MSNEIRRKKTGDAEMDAIHVINQALAPLTRDQADRVLKWAEGRFVHVVPLVEKESLDGVNAFFEGVVETAKRLNTDSQTVLRAVGRVVEELPPLIEEAA